MKKYKAFSTSLEFEEWQTGDEKIYSMVPIGLDIGVKADGNEAEASLNYGLMIIYEED